MAHTIIRAARATHKPMVVGVLVLSMLATLVAPLAVFVAQADHGGPYGDTEMKKIVLCHWDASAKPDPAYKSSGDVSVNAAINSHGDVHEDDIVPPFHYSGGSYPGLNWNDTNADIWGVDGSCDGDGVLEASLTLVKEVINDDDGTLEASDFTLYIDGNEVTTEVAETLDPGTYDISEDNEDGYVAGDWSCVETGTDTTFTMDDSDTVTLENGDDVTCTIVNDDEEGEPEIPMYSIFGIVFNDEDNDGEDWECDSEEEICEELLEGWVVFLDENENGILDEGEEATTSGEGGHYGFSVPAGTYTICEVVKSGWVGKYGSDCHLVTVGAVVQAAKTSVFASIAGLFTVQAAHAQAASFNFGNFQTPVVTTTGGGGGGGGGSPNLVIEKTVSDEFTTGGSTLTYTITVTNTGNATATAVVVEDVMDAFLDGTPGSTRTWSLGSIGAGQSKTVTYLIDVPPGIDPGVYQNVATVSAANFPARSSDADVEVREPEVLGEEDIPEPEVKGIETLPETGGISNAMATFGLVTLTLLALYAAAIAGFNRRREMQN